MSEAISAGFYDVPQGHVATVVTHLEMRHRVETRAEQGASNLAIQHQVRPETDWYRSLFRSVGALEWLWFSRLAMEDKQLASILSDPGVEVYALSCEGTDLGLLELDFRTEGECELAFFGVAPELIGSGAGRFLMNRAVDIAWARPISRFHVHTCTLDHPAALSFYIRSGFKPTRQQIEIAPDPRLVGLLPENAGPHVPIIR